MSSAPPSLLDALGDDFRALYVTPTDRASAGVWRDAPGAPGKRLCLRYLHSEPVERAMYDWSAARRKARGGAAFTTDDLTFDDVQAHGRQRVAFAVAAWDGFGDTPCTTDHVLALLTLAPAFAEWAARTAADAATFGLHSADDLEALAKNSSPASATPSAAAVPSATP